MRFCGKFTNLISWALLCSLCLFKVFLLFEKGICLFILNYFHATARMVKSDIGDLALQKKRRMRNNRKKRRRQQRAIIKRAAVSKDLAEKIAEGIREQKFLAEKYSARWKRIAKEATDLRTRLNRRQVSRHCTLIGVSTLYSQVI